MRRAPIAWCLMLGALFVPLWALAGDVPPALRARAASEGSVRVIAELPVAVVAEGSLRAPARVADQRARIARAGDTLLAELAGSGHRVTRRFATIPFLALEAPPEALDRLARSQSVLRLTEDERFHASLPQSTPLVEATDMVANGYTGGGQTVAILDTGVDSTHPFLAGAVVAEACFSAGSDCPNGQTTQTGAGSAAPCSYANGCLHGTHVAGIAAGNGTAFTSFNGVAPNASVLAIQVFSKFVGGSCSGAGENPCAESYVSDQVAGLEYVLSVSSSYSIAAVNMSLGGSTYTSQATCDTHNAAMKSVIDNLRSAGIATVVAAGNDGATNAIAAPACISSAVSVGSTTKSDVVSSFSDSASFLSLLAPGQPIYSSIPGGGFAYETGTSMAAPHVAGAFALLRSFFPAATVNDLISALQLTGLPVTDSRNGLVKPRIEILDATNYWLTLATVGNAGAADTGNAQCGPGANQPCGAVAHPYRFGIYEVTNLQYASFLNAVAASDPNGLYNANMASGSGGIARSGSSGSYRYALIAGRELLPVDWVSWYDALRFANWVHNGRPTGAQGSATTEDGAYTFSGPTSVGTRNPGAKIFLPTEDEWYKAAYFDPGTSSWFAYPAASNGATTCSAPTAAANSANCGSVAGDLTIRGAYGGSASPSGAFDQGGNASEWNETDVAGDGSLRGVRGGSFTSGAGDLAASQRGSADPTTAASDRGFRVAPEPGRDDLLITGVLALAILRRAAGRRGARAGRSTARASTSTTVREARTR